MTELIKVGETEEAKKVAVGDIIFFEGKNWRVTKYDGFMLSADNLDVEDKDAALMWVGNIEQHDFEVVSKTVEELKATDNKVINISSAQTEVTETEQEINPSDYEPIVSFEGKTDDEIKQFAKDKIECESEVCPGRLPVILLYHMILSKIDTDVDFAKRILIKSKTLAKAYDYVWEFLYNIAKKQSKLQNEQSVCLEYDEKELFNLIVEYYSLDDYEIDKKKAEKEAEKEAERKAESKKRKEIIKQISKSKSKSKPSKPKKEKAEKEKTEIDSQLNLIDMLGGF